MNDIHKVSYFMPVSTELLAEHTAMSQLLDAAFTRRPDPEAAARQKAERAARLQEHLARHRAVLATLDGKLAAVLDLHKPHDHGGWDATCDGCDFAGYEAEEPEWPCRTWLLVAEQGPERSLSGP